MGMKTGAQQKRHQVGDEGEAMLGTRIPRAVYQRLRVHCVEHECTIQQFVAAAIDEKLAAQGSGASR